MGIESSGVMQSDSVEGCCRRGVDTLEPERHKMFEKLEKPVEVSILPVWVRGPRGF